jgi:creatinine amidohydrolase/Fe(II)-dependent formamide hydrolase-like protein
VRPSMLAATRAGAGHGAGRVAGESGTGQAGASLPLDAHAGRVETSIMLALAPGDVRLDAAAPGETRPLAEIMADLRARGVRQVSPNGVLGDPAGASAAEGETLLGLLVADLAVLLDRLTEARAMPGDPALG